MAFIGKEGEGEEGVMTKRPIDKKGKLNIQCFSLKKEEKEENVIFNKREKKALKAHESSHSQNHILS